MATKVYGIYGRTTVEINLPVGKATLPLIFERGCLDRKNFRPATFITSKKYIQDMIENSNMFGKSIILVKVYGNEQAAERKPAKSETKKQTDRTSAASKAKEVANTSKSKEAEDTETGAEGNADGTIDYPDVTSKEEAIAVLKSLGAKATDFKDDDALPALMAKYKVTFSNFSL